MESIYVTMKVKKVLETYESVACQDFAGNIVMQYYELTCRE